MSGKDGHVQRSQVQGEQTATGAPKEKFGTGTAAQSEAGKKGGQIAKERGAGIMQNPSEFGKKGGRARGGEQDE